MSPLVPFLQYLLPIIWILAGLSTTTLLIFLFNDLLTFWRRRTFLGFCGWLWAISDSNRLLLNDIFKKHLQLLAQFVTFYGNQMYFVDNWVFPFWTYQKLHRHFQKIHNDRKKIKTTFHMYFSSCMRKFLLIILGQICSLWEMKYSYVLLCILSDQSTVMKTQGANY